ncbi:FtsK/SpoIIIE domain-containing protein [Arthrobacter sp. W4I7]|uniref:FtsK/SpoIIIE domain-containing protein n=1 Tax=Arthrobacter sp. W4I7 TaxID=3042296 RepID=UPI0027869D2B|nr:FtsK/SpoIIIE domain-containing protein [Arthrobacter sp. W4I7]MDQ0690369.1 S-DNA-T family DNA segregation ATPase FtsK/SpoIIIE [Arthrobacter sp. W4I7]
MKFHCTLVRSTGSGLQEPPLELTVQAPEGAAGSDIQIQLTRRFGTGAVSTCGKDLGSLSVGTAPLVNGAVLVDGASHPGARKLRRRVPTDRARLALAVHSGVGAGTVVPLHRGSYTIGRSGTRIVIPDPELSREHARLDVTETDIMIIDVDSANGIIVDGERVRNAAISTDSVIRCGNTTMSLVLMDMPENALANAGMSAQQPLIVAGRAETGNRAMLILTAALPLLIGVGLAVVTGMWMFLAFSAASAVSVLVPLATGRSQRRDLAKAVAAAVAEDRKRRRGAGPSLARLVLAGRQQQSSKKQGGQTQVAPASCAEGGGVWLRLGEAPQPANVTVEPASSPVSLPTAGIVPVVLDPGVPKTTFRGPGVVVDGLVRSIVMQLAGYPRARGTHILLVGASGRLPLGARYLRGATLTTSHDEARQILAEVVEPKQQHQGVLILLGASKAQDDDVTAATAAGLGWQVLQFLPAGGGSDCTLEVQLSERTSVLRSPAGDVDFVPDLAPEAVFNDFCRKLAGQPDPPDPGPKAVPTYCSLQELLPLSPDSIAARWHASANTRALKVPLGVGTTGTRSLDLNADGPHLLVAGTTGSGKSELLRTLTLALALTHPPDRVNFLFVDFKGGSGLGPLAELVHCVGLLTDLSTYELERTLASLRAEIRLREEALAAAQVPDLAAYRSTAASRGFPLPHLVIVIDEFRMLVDDAPEVLRELMRIAAIGRSLGIHLVMATQRPQGSVTADIRANVTSSIALRVQSDMESSDIISTKAAAGISVGTPGRAFLARGTEAPREFQTASIGTAPDGSCQAGVVTVLPAVEWLASQGAGRAGSGGARKEYRARQQTPAQAARPWVAMVQHLWHDQKGQAPRRPVAAPLPSTLQAPHSKASLTPPDSGGGTEWFTELGLIDRPEQQEVAPLVWKPGQHSHLALVGGPSSGAPEALELAVAGLILNPVEAHGYLLDAGGTFLSLANSGHIGAHVGPHELRRAVRVLERLKQEMARRLSQGGRKGEAPLILAISGWGSWISALRAGPLAWAEDLVQDLVRDGSRADIVVMIAGDRELVSSRTFASLPNRLYFPTGSNPDSRIAWPRMPATPELKGRAVAFGPVSGGGPAVCQLYNPDPQTFWKPGFDGEKAPEKRPFRVEQLPALVPAAGISSAETSSATCPLDSPGETKTAAGTSPSSSSKAHRLLLGIGGDELEPASVRIPDGGVLTVLGGPGSGKTNFLQALPLMNPAGGPWLRAEGESDPDDFWEQELAAAAAGGMQRGTVALVDDADLLPAETLQHLSELNALGAAVVVTASYSPLLLQRVPLVMKSRASGNGVLLAPRSLPDGDLFGIRFEVEANPPPGRGVLISQGSARSIQVGLAAEPVRGPVSNSPYGRRT